MPIYEYRCIDCGRRSEILHRAMAGEQPLVCSHCGSSKLERMISSPGSIVMGGSRKGTTCCGREERCSTPPCADDGACRRDR
jgi:putative FmdB family regulatory protein